MRPTPDGWPRVTASLCYDDAPAAIAFLAKAFGFEARLVVESGDGRVVHSELEFGDGLLMVSSAGRRPFQASPRAVDGRCTQSLMVFVDDVDAHCARARAAGAIIAQEPKTTDYGEGYWSDRTCEAIDLEGHHWWFTQRMSTAPGPARRGVVPEISHE
jgi:uncharacterized glyoxalase superfamily protein PhnB